MIAALLLAPLLSACAPAPVTEQVADPYEARNRQVFQANLALNAAVSDVASGGGNSIPPQVTRAVSNLATNLRTPGIVVNDLLQRNTENAIHNGFRFILNTTLGVGGLFDPASSFGLEPRDNDFGKTLYSYGVRQGNYVMLPVIGPATERDLVGKVVDSALNPLGFWLPDTEMNWARGVKVADLAAQRLRFGDSIDSVLRDSADPYAQTRAIYMQNRNYELSGGQAESTYIDPYDALYTE